MNNSSTGANGPSLWGKMVRGLLAGFLLVGMCSFGWAQLGQSNKNKNNNPPPPSRKTPPVQSKSNQPIISNPNPPKIQNQTFSKPLLGNQTHQNKPGQVLSGTVGNANVQTNKGPVVVKTPTKIKLPTSTTQVLGTKKTGSGTTGGKITLSKPGQTVGGTTGTNTGKINLGKIDPKTGTKPGPIVGGTTGTNTGKINLGKIDPKTGTKPGPIVGGTTGTNTGKVNLGKIDPKTGTKPGPIVGGTTGTNPGKINIGKIDPNAGTKPGQWTKGQNGWVWKPAPGTLPKPPIGKIPPIAKGPGPNINNTNINNTNINVTNVTNKTTVVRIGIPFWALGGFTGYLPPPFIGGGGGVYDPVYVDPGPPVIVQEGSPGPTQVVETPPQGSTGPTQVAETPPDQTDTAEVIPNAQQITDIYEGPAQNAGLRGGDIILVMNDRRIRNFYDLQDVLKSAQGDCTLVFYSASKNQVEQLTIRPVEGRIGAAVLDVQVDIEEDSAQPEPPPEPSPAPGPVLATKPSTKEPAKENPPENTGVTALRITEVLKGPATRAGFQAGDILLGINGQPVRNETELNTLLATVGEEIEVAFFSPEEQKADVRRLSLASGTMGLNFELVTVATTR